MPEVDSPSGERGSSSAKGCLVVALIAAAAVGVALIGIVLAYGMFGARRATMLEYDPTVQRGRQDHTVVLQKDQLADFSPTEFEGALTREHFVAITAANDLTSLARDAFAEAAFRTPVEWVMRVTRIKKLDEERISAEFELDYSIRDRNSTRSSAIQVEAVFSMDQYDKLISLRNGQWVKVKGQLNAGGDFRRVTIIDPELVPPL